MHFKAGYIVDAIASVISDYKFGLDKKNPNDKKQLNQINGLLQYVNSFDVEFPYPQLPDFKKLIMLKHTVSSNCFNRIKLIDVILVCSSQLKGVKK